MTALDLQHRRHILLTMLTTLAIRYPPGREPELVRLLRGWLEGWSGVGRVLVGMTRQGFDCHLVQYNGAHWRATFYPAGQQHSPARAVGTAWEPSPARAVPPCGWVTVLLPFTHPPPVPIILRRCATLTPRDPPARLEPVMAGAWKDTMRHLARSGLIGLVLASAPSLAFGEPIQRHVGKVEQVDLGEGLIILDQLVAQQRHLRHLIYVKPDTEILATRRLRPWEMRGSQAFEEIPVALPDVVTGDFVVVESLQEGSRSVARRITVVETGPRLHSSP